MHIRLALLILGLALPAAANDLIVGTARGVGQVRVIDGDQIGAGVVSNSALVADFFPFGTSFTSGVHVAGGDVTGDGIDDIVMSMAAEGQQVIVLDGAYVASNGLTGVLSPTSPAIVRSFDAFTLQQGFHGGVHVALGDVDGDARDDIVVGMASQGGRVRVLSGRDGTELGSFEPFGASYSNGCPVATGDVDGDCTDEIVVCTDGGVQAAVHVVEPNGALLSNGAPFGGFTGGVRVAAGDVNGDHDADIIAAVSESGYLSTVVVYDGISGSVIDSFFAFNTSFTAGIHVDSVDHNGDGTNDIVIAPKTGLAHVRVVDGGRIHETEASGEISSSARLADFYAYTLSYTAGAHVGGLAAPGLGTQIGVGLVPAIGICIPSKPDVCYVVQTSTNAVDWETVDHVNGTGGPIFRSYVVTNRARYVRAFAEP